MNRQHTHTLKNIYCKARDNSEEVTSSNPQNCIVHILPAIMKITVIASLLSSAGAFLSPPAANGNGFPLSSSTATTTDLERREESTFIAQPLQDNTLKSVQAIQDISRAEYENGKFECNDGVEFWMNYNRNGKYELEDYARVTTDVSSRFFSEGGGALSYWLRHTARSGYFISNAALGTLSSQLHERLRSKEPSESKVTNALPSAASALPRILAEVALSYEQDYERISQGKYKLPYDMYTRNRQNSPLYFGSKTARFLSEAIGILSRRNRGSEEDKRIWLSDDSIYPDYYKTAFHYQTDGWMSPDSADVYETSTETLFLGGQDVMQRTALVPLLEYANDSTTTMGESPLKVLEVGCGTGRFLTFVRDNLPLDSECTAVDLSPFYLNNARDNDKNWMSIRKRMEASNGSEGIKIDPATFVQAKGEDLPFENEEFDVVVCMYVYHEVPRDIRAQISSEMERVTKKGGMVILTDSMQKGDRPGVDSTLGNFKNMNEPYYEDYIADCLPDHFEKVGLECLTKIHCRSTKTLAFRKPI